MLTSKKNFYKGNLHCHSTLSDGRFTPQELKEHYKSKGYSILAITDHENINNNSYLDDEDFLTITSTEIAIKQFPERSTLVDYNMKVCHLNLYAKQQDNDINVCYNSVLDHFTKGEARNRIKKLGGEYERIYGKDGINDIIRIANENGFFVCYNHPRWSLENYSDYCGYDGLWGVEIFNTGNNVSGMYEYNINVLDDFLRDGKRVFASSGDDNHNACGFRDSFKTFVSVNAESLDYDTIINALLNGDFYTSTGPTISELYVENGEAFIKCSPAAQITFSTSGRRTESAIADEGTSICEAKFSIHDADRYFRIDVVDEFGHRANTQAYFLDQLDLY